MNKNNYFILLVLALLYCGSSCNSTTNEKSKSGGEYVENSEYQVAFTCYYKDERMWRIEWSNPFEKRLLKVEKGGKIKIVRISQETLEKMERLWRNIDFDVYAKVLENSIGAEPHFYNIEYTKGELKLNKRLKKHDPLFCFPRESDALASPFEITENTIFFDSDYAFTLLLNMLEVAVSTEEL